MNLSNAAVALYLNPEWQAFSNVRTTAQASALISTSNAQTSLEAVPLDFHAATFLCANSRDLDISPLNATIRLAMTSNDLQRSSRYLPTLQLEARCTASNRLQLLALSMDDVTDRLLRPGDILQAIQITDATGASLLMPGDANVFGTVLQRPVPNQLVLSLSNRRSLQPDAKYLVVGHQLADPERQARICFLRTPSNARSNFLFQQDPQFNYSMYRLLYPDAARLDRDSAYLDSISRARRLDFRVSKVQDLAFYNEQFGLQVQGLRVLDGGLVVSAEGGLRMGGDTVVHGISDDHVLPPTPGSSCNLITERAAKAFALAQTQTFLAVPVFSNTVTMLNGANIQGTTIIHGPTVHSNIATFGNTVHFQAQDAADPAASAVHFAVPVWMSNVLRVDSNALFTGPVAFQGHDSAVDCAVPFNVSNVLRVNSNALFTGPVAFQGHDSAVDCAVPFNVSNVLRVNSNAVFTGPVTFQGQNSTVDCAVPFNVSNVLRVNSNAVFLGPVTHSNHVRFDSNVHFQRAVVTFCNCQVSLQGGDGNLQSSHDVQLLGPVTHISQLQCPLAHVSNMTVDTQLRTRRLVILRR
jgi:hypothetical protein